MRAEAALIEELRMQLAEAQETIDAIRNGDVDAVVVGGAAGQQVYTLANADRPYRILIEQMQEGALTLSERGTILFCNERFATMVCVHREMLIGADIDTWLPEAHVASFKELLGPHSGTKQTAALELRRSSGTHLPVNFSFVDLTVDEGTARVICAVVTDLGPIHQRADELADANAKLAVEYEERRRAQDSLQLALDAAGMGHWDLDLDSNTSKRSFHHDQLFGYSAPVPHWNLETALQHFLPDDRQVVIDAFADSKNTSHLEFQARIHRVDDGSTRWIRVLGQIFYEGTRATRIAGVISDITDQRAMDDRLRQAEKMEAIGQLTGGVAHDFNNLLMVISGGLEMMARQKDPGRIERTRAAMRQAVDRGSSLSRQLLAFSRRQELQPEPLDLVRKIEGMRELLDRSLRGDVHVVTELPEGLWPVEVDPGELELVLLNLAVNARDALPTGGTITIRASNAPNLQEPGLSGDFVRLSVIDTGTGMSPEVLGRVFEPFFTTKEVGKGSGLGLAQAHGFAKASGGTVRATSQLGVGTEFTLLLPRTFKPVDSSAAPLIDFAVARPRGPAAGDILVVEDDDEVAAMIVGMLEELGYSATRVASADAALGALANGRSIDLVFSDVMMPGDMNGVELARAIALRRPGLPVLLTSGYAEAAKAQAEHDGIEILSKPYRLQELDEALRRHHKH